MTRFLIDNQLPSALVRWLEAKGCVATHVLALRMEKAPDESIWKFAAREQYVIVSKDEDFSRLTLVRPDKVQVLWLRLGNSRTPALLAALERTWPQISAQLQSGATLVEVV